MLRVSVVIPCFNAHLTLEEAIASVRWQIRQPDELIVVDDCSTDASADIARGAGATVEANARNSGEGFSRNAGIEAATGDVICFLDADDVWLPRHIETVVGLLESNPAASASFAAVQRFGRRNETILGLVPPGPPSNVLRQAFSNWVHTTIGSCVRRSAAREIGGFDEHERYSVDFDFWLRLARGRLFAATHETTSCWRWHDTNQSMRRHRQIEAVYRFRRRFLDRLIAHGDGETALLLGGDMPRIWRREMVQASSEGDAATLGFLRSEGARMFGISMPARLDCLLHRSAREAVAGPLRKLGNLARQQHS